MSTPAPAAVRRLRRRGHLDIQRLADSRGWSLRGTYAWVAKKMELSLDQMHFGLFDKEQCELAIAVIKRYRRK